MIPQISEPSIEVFLEEERIKMSIMVRLQDCAAKDIINIHT